MINKLGIRHYSLFRSSLHHNININSINSAMSSSPKIAAATAVSAFSAPITQRHQYPYPYPCQYHTQQRQFSTTARRLDDEERIPFDTKKFNDELVASNFNRQQSETVIKIISMAINKGINSLIDDLVTKETLSTLSYKQKVDFVKLKGELQSLDKSELYNINNEYERVRLELEKLRQKLREEISKTQAGVRLDLSLEKGRIKEESSMHNLHIKETDTRIDQEISNMKMQIDSVKTQVMQWLIGVCTGTFALILAYVRLVM